MEQVTEIDFCEEEAEMPCTLSSILDPQEAIAASQRMQRWYRSAPQGVASSVFGRDGRRVMGRPAEIAAEEAEEV
jgi:hypothetical protein